MRHKTLIFVSASAVGVGKVIETFRDFYILPHGFAYACRQNVETGTTECEPLVVGELPYWFEVPLRFVAMWCNQDNIFVCYEDALREVETPQALGEYILIGEKCFNAWGWLYWRDGKTEAVENFTASGTFLYPFASNIAETKTGGDAK